MERFCGKWSVVEGNFYRVGREETDKNVGIDFAENIRVGGVGRARGTKLEEKNATRTKEDRDDTNRSCQTDTTRKRHPGIDPRRYSGDDVCRQRSRDFKTRISAVSGARRRERLAARRLAGSRATALW